MRRVFIFLLLTVLGQISFASLDKTPKKAYIEQLKGKLDASFGINRDSADIWTYDLIKVAHELEDWASVIAGYRYKGVYAYEDDRFEEAIGHFQHVYELLSLHPVAEELFYYYYTMSFMYTAMGDEDKAFEFMLKAEKFCKENDRSDLLLRVYSDLIYSYSDKNFEKGLEYAQDFKELLEVVDYEYVIYDEAQFNHALGRMYVLNGKFDKGRYHLKRSEKMTDSLNWKACQINAQMDLGRMYVKMDQLDSAEMAFNKGLKVIEGYPTDKRKARLFGSMGDLFSKKKDWKKAISYYTQAYELIQGVKMRKSDLSFIKGLSMAYEQIGEYEKAISWIDIRDSIRERINLSEQDARIAFLENENRVDQLLQDKEIEKQAIRYQYWVIIGICGILVAIAIIMLKYQKNEVKRKELEQALLVKQQEQLGNKLEVKSKELVAKLLYLQQKNKLIDQTTKDLLDMKLSLDKKGNQNKIQDIIDGLKVGHNDNLWEEFEKHFIEVYTSFYASLNKFHPKLSPSERKLCAFLKLNMSSKEIAAITFQSVSSIDTARARLRKKLGLVDRNDSLVSYLAQF